MPLDPHAPTRALEAAIAEYCGAPFAVATNSCTMALELALLWQRLEGNTGNVMLPARTYPSVRQAIARAGFKPTPIDMEWQGAYRLTPTPVWDAARRLTSRMYIQGQFMCLSFHVAKLLGDTQGGMILHDDKEADKYFRRARFDGRSERTPCHLDTYPLPDTFTRHCYMSPDVAARLLNHMQYLPRHNADLVNDPYPYLGTLQ